LPIGLHAVAGRSDILIVVREPGATIDVIERMCPHYIGHPREPRKDLILYGDIARRSDGSCQLTCFHRNPAWDLPSGGSVLPSVQDIAVYSSALIDGQLLADLADWRRAA
jgi:hypothetical protein